MNKYSKRALKTTATVGMSLAMVLSAAAPVMAADAIKGGVCDALDFDEANDVVKCGRLVFAELFEKDILDYDMDSSLSIKIATTADADPNEVNAFYAVNEYANELDAYALTLSLAEAKTVTAWTKATNAIVEMFEKAFEKGIVLDDADSITEILLTADAGKLAVIYKNITNASGKTEDWSTSALMKDLTGEKLKALKDAKKAMDDFANEEKGAYKHLSSNLKDVFDSVKTDFDALYDEAFGSSTDAELAKFVVTLDKVLKNDLEEKATTLTSTESDITGFPESVSAIKLSSKSQVNGRIKKIKEANMYNTVKDEESVIAILDAYQAILDDLAGTSDLTKETAYVDYIKTKTDDAGKTVKAAVADIATPNELSLDHAKNIAKALDNEQFEILKALKEDVLDSIYTLQTRKIGNYHINDTVESKTVVSTQKTTITKNVDKVFTALVDTEKGLFGYDVVADHMEAFNDALAAITTDIAKITPANIKAADKATLEAAEDALYDLGNKYAKNLTSKEARDVRNADRKLMNLREAFDNLGTTTATGWYDKGNGNWGFNNEDGTPATKWVAAGTNWYYVKGGNMLRNAWIAENASGARWYYVNDKGVMVTNAVVDGYTIDANGIWTK